MISFKGRHYQQDIILQCVRWYVAYPLSYRDLEQLMQERGYVVDHSTIQRWVVHYAHRIEKRFARTRNGLGIADGLMRPILRLKANGNIFIALSIS